MLGVDVPAAQAIAGVQVALGANSPYLFGRELWRETRITLFQQATDTRPEALRQMTQRYIEHMHANEPVHTWPLEP